MLAALCALLGEVEVLDHDRREVVGRGQAHQLGDGRPQPPIAGGGSQAGQFEGDRDRAAHWVARRIDHHGSEVPSVDIDGQHRVPAQLVERRRLPLGVSSTTRRDTTGIASGRR